MTSSPDPVTDTQRLAWLAAQPAVSLWWGSLAATGARVHDICAMTLDGGTVLENIGTGPTLADAIDDAMARTQA